MEIKEKKKSNGLTGLKIFMKPYLGKYAISVIISILSVALSILSYVFAGKIASNMFSSDPIWNTILILAIVAILCKIGHSILLNLSTWISHKAAYKTLKDMRLALTEKMLKLPVGYFEENGSGRLKAILVDHVESMEKTLAHMLPELTANLLAPLACIIWMFFIDWRLALAVLVWIFLGFSVTGGMMKGYEEKYAAQIQRFKSMNQAIVEYVNGIEVIKNFGRSDECYKKYSDAVYEHASYNWGWQKETQIYSALGMAISPFSIFPVLILGLIFYANGSLEAGTLFLVIILTFGIFGPLMNAMTYFDQVAGMQTNVEEIKDILDYPELKRVGTANISSSSIEFNKVSFAYEKNDEAVIKDISFKIPEHTMFALVGPSGSGKSTIAKLIAGFWDANSGEIKIGDQPITSYSQEQLNNMIAYVDQDTFLFDENILDNIRIAKRDASIEEVISAAKSAGCHEFIEALPNGYNTEAGVAGRKLSGGEKQRIAIARAMMKDAPIMILDEATASSDSENEASIQSALSAAAKDKTLIVIAHRLETIVEAQQIAFVNNGKIEAIGTHQELLLSCPEYNKMWKLVGGEVNA